MNTQIHISSTDAGLRGLAIVGFIALVAAGMWLAVYSARYVPTAVGGLGAAAVSLSSVFTPADGGLSVVPTATTTIPFPEASSTPVVTAPSTPTTSGGTPTAGTPTNGTYPIGGNSSGTLSGQSDLVVSINAVGYLATSSADSFVASATVPSGTRAAVRFTIKNIGTNVSGSWRFSANIPTQSFYLFQSLPQQSLNPNDSIDYVLGFDQANKGAQTITVNADYEHTVAEPNETNNTATAQVTVQ